MICAGPFFNFCKTRYTINTIRSKNKCKCACIFFAGNTLIFFTRLHYALRVYNVKLLRNGGEFFGVSGIRIVAFLYIFIKGLGKAMYECEAIWELNIQIIFFEDVIDCYIISIFIIIGNRIKLWAFLFVESHENQN